MRSRALQAYSGVRSGRPDTSHYPETKKLDEDFDELALFGGQTKILVVQWLTSSSKTEPLQLPTPPSQPSPSVDLPATSPSSSAGFSTPADDMNQVHPALVDYISAFSPPDINSLQNLMGIEPIPTFNYSEPPALQSDPSWANYMALPTNESFGNNSSHPFTFSEVPQSSKSPAIAETRTGLGQFYDEPWTAFLQTPGIFQLDHSQPYFMTDESTM